MDAKHLFGQWKAVRQGLLQALDKLTDEQLQFTPREGLGSIGAVARHIAESDELWLRHFVHGKYPDSWDGWDVAHYPTVSAVKDLLSETHQRTEQWLDTLPNADLDREVTLPYGSTASVGWCIWHVLEHEIHHRGEIYLMLGLLGMEAPDV